MVSGELSDGSCYDCFVHMKKKRHESGNSGQNRRNQTTKLPQEGSV